MFTFTSDDGVVIHVHEWPTEQEPRGGVVQLAHGMGEHAKRYAHVAEALNARGFHVYAADHRGHGESMHAGPGNIGDDGWNRLVADMVTLTGIIRDKHPPGLPVVLLSHSLGSFASQQYILDHSHLIDAVALSGDHRGRSTDREPRQRRPGRPRPVQCGIRTGPYSARLAQP